MTEQIYGTPCGNIYYWIKDAGHNSNTDAPEIVNRLIEELVKKL